MLVFLFGSMLVLSAVCREIRVGVTVDADVSEGNGSLRACVFRVPLVRQRFNFDLETKTVAPAPVKSAAKTALDKPHPIKSLLPLLHNLRISCAEIELHIGSTRDPLFTTLAFGSARMLFASLLGVCKARFPLAKVSARMFPNFQSDCAYVQASSVVYISIADVLYGAMRHAIVKSQKQKLASGTVAAK